MDITVVSPITEWKETFVIFPRTTVSGKRVFFEKVFTRRVWAVYGDARFHLEPDRQYATIFDMLTMEPEEKYNEDD